MIINMKADTITYTVALAGNPNVGKSTLFNAMTKLRQHTGNWPGKTVETASGYYESDGVSYCLVDLPGTYSLAAHSAEEEVTRDYLKSDEPDAAIVVCDATCLERNLILVLQVLELIPNTVVCVNLLDEAKRKHINVDLAALEADLHVPVIGICASEPKQNVLEKNLNKLMAAVKRVIEEPPSPIKVRYPSSPEGEELHEEKRAAALVLTAEGICNDAVECHAPAPHCRDRKIDRILLGKYTGLPVMLCLLFLVLWITMAGANYPSALLSGFFEWLGDKLSGLLVWLNSPAWLESVLVDGIYRVLSWVVAVMLPPMAIFFPLFTLLEDVGYLPRVAFNLDHSFKKAGACGKQALTLCMGFGCNAVGVTGCRIIDSPRERIIAALTNVFVPCNGRFPTLIAIITMFFAGAAASFSSFASAAMVTGVILLGIGMTFLISRFLSKTLLKGLPSSFALELPPYRKPQILKVLLRSLLDRTLFVLGRAVCVAAPAGLVIWIMANISIDGSTLLTICSSFLDPFGRALGMDGVIILSFILGFPANEIVIPLMLMMYTASGTIFSISDLSELKGLLVSNGWTWVTAVSTLLFCLFHFPCSTTCMTIKKETGSAKWTLLGFLLPTAVGIVICFLFASAARLIL